MIKIDPDIVIEEQTVNVVQTNKEVKDTQKMIKNTHQVFINMDRDLNQEFIIKDIKTIKEQPLENECDLLKCPSCPMFFDRTHLLKDHMASAHNSVPTYVVQSMPIEPQLNSGLRCTNCNNFYANKYSLRKHLRKTKCRMMSEMTINKVISEQLTCGKCKKQFGSILALNKHVSANKCSKPPKKPKQDPVPNKVPLVYDESIQLGPNDKIEVFKCPLCSKPCVTLRAFRMHAKCVHKDNNLEPENEEAKANFVCNVRGCGKLFVEEKQLDTHFKHHENFTPRSGKHKCHLCKETFLQKIMLKKHILRTHKEATSVNKKKKSELRSLKKKNGYIRSMEDPVDLKYDPGITLIPGTMMDALKCPVCGKSSFTDSKAFKLHCMHIHKDKSLKPIAIQQEAKYICQVENCGKLFIEQKQFRIHQQHHKTYVPSAGRFFNCTQCEAKFTTQDNLEVHSIQFHSGGDDVTSCQNNLIFDDITLAPGTIMTVYHCPVDNCPKRNYLDAKSVKTHCRRRHNMSSATLFEIVPMKREAQFICQVRGCRKLFAEAYQIEAHLKHHRTYIPTNGHFDCKLCDESFKRKELLDQHTKDYHTSNSQNEINEIQNTDIKHTVHGSMLSTNDTTPKVQVRLNTVSGYQCSICMRKFLHLGTHRNHVTNAHHTPSLDPLEVEVKPKYYCPSPGCKKYFMTKYREKLHAERHCIKGDNQDKNNLKCHKCQKKFCKFKSLIQHLKQTHADVSTEEITEMEAKYAIRHMPYGEVTENSQEETYDDSLQAIPDRKDIQESQDENCDDSMQTE